VNQIKHIAKKIHCTEQHTLNTNKERGNFRRNIIQELEQAQECDVPFDAPSPILIQVGLVQPQGAQALIQIH
jgi:hypothetical protein